MGLGVGVHRCLPFGHELDGLQVVAAQRVSQSLQQLHVSDVFVLRDAVLHL